MFYFNGRVIVLKKERNLVFLEIVDITNNNKNNTSYGLVQCYGEKYIFFISTFRSQAYGLPQEKCKSKETTKERKGGSKSTVS